jgi:hypothetical protein
MEQNKAIQILIEVALVAQSKGALSLDDAVIVKEAIETFRPKEEESEAIQEGEL